MHGNILNFCFCSKNITMHDIPSSDSFICPLRKGFLQKLTGKSWLYSGSWKSRYCVLDGSKFYFYEKEQSKGSEKNCGVINLDYYDLCEESKSKDKKNPHVFVIGTSVKGLFDNRHQFGAETPDEMQAWIHSIQTAIKEARITRTKAGRKQRNDGKSPDLNNDSTQESEDVAAACLVNATKDRAKGPQGRRLPQRKSMMPTPTSGIDANDIRQRSISLSSPKDIVEEQDEDESSSPQFHTSGDNKWLSMSMEEMERGSDDAFEAQRSSSAFDIQKDSTTPNESEHSSKPVQKRLGPRLGNLLGQHAALTKELEMKLKIGRPTPKKQHSENEADDPKNSEDESGRNIEQLAHKVDSAKDSLIALEEKVSQLSKKVDVTHDSHETATTKVGDVLLQVTVTLQEAERVNAECKRALEEVNKARTEYQSLVKECRQTLARLNSSETEEHAT